MPSYISGVMRYLAQNPDKPLSLKVLSSKFNISEPYLSERFKYHTGLTLRTYFLEIKIRHAKEMLMKGAGITECCYESGFQDYSNFMRSFKKVTGMTPNQFRKTL